MIKNLIKNIYKSYKYKKEDEFFNEILNYIDFDIVENKSPEKTQIVTFVLPGMPAYSGGHTSILRLGTLLSELGYNVNYLSYTDQNLNSMKKNAKINLTNYKGDLHTKDKLFNFESDIYIATSWVSAYYTKNMEGYKMYFVQDYEPYFFQYGEKYLLAKKTYELGFHIVSLGSWNKKMIQNNCQNFNRVDHIEFPYEKSEYNKIKRNFVSYKNKKEFNMAVYLKLNKRRAPHIIQRMLGSLKKEFKKDGIKININYFGENKGVNLKNGKNLGKLSKDDLAKLYKESDFGMTASLTNISLVPYEMMATGLPIIEFEEGTFDYFFDSENAILTSFDWKDLYLKLKNIIKSPKKINCMVEGNYQHLDNLSWEKSAKQFDNIIKTL